MTPGRRGVGRGGLRGRVEGGGKGVGVGLKKTWCQTEDKSGRGGTS